MAFHCLSTWISKKEKENLQVLFPLLLGGRLSLILHISRHWRDDTHTPSPKPTTQQCLPWALAGNHYSIWFVLSGNSRATQMGPAVLTFLMMAPSSGRAAWTTRSDPGTCVKGDSCSSMTSPHRCSRGPMTFQTWFCEICDILRGSWCTVWGSHFWMWIRQLKILVFCVKLQQYIFY